MRQSFLTLLIIALLAATGSALCGCGVSGKEEAAVVTTTPIVADIVRSITGPGFKVTSLLDVSSDPHEYEPRPSDMAQLAKAKLIVRSGGEIDSWLSKLTTSARSGVKVVDLKETLESSARRSDDAHWWHNPRNVVSASYAVERALVDLYPVQRAQISSNAKRYRERLTSVDKAIEECLGRIPADSRTLVTGHPGFSHYQTRYGLQSVGSAFASGEAVSEPSAAHIAQLVTQMKVKRVRAIFAEHGSDARLEQKVAHLAGARLVPGLMLDTLAAHGPANSYIGTLTQNTRTVAAGLTDGKTKCSLPF